MHIAYLLEWDCNESSCVGMPDTLLQAANCVSLRLSKNHLLQISPTVDTQPSFVSTVNQVERTFCTEEFARDVESFASDDDDFLAIKQLLGHGTGQATQEMSLAIDDDLK